MNAHFLHKPSRAVLGELVHIFCFNYKRKDSPLRDSISEDSSHFFGFGGGKGQQSMLSIGLKFVLELAVNFNIYIFLIPE